MRVPRVKYLLSVSLVLLLNAFLLFELVSQEPERGNFTRQQSSQEIYFTTNSAG